MRENPTKMDDLGVPPFLETLTCWRNTKNSENIQITFFECPSMKPYCDIVSDIPSETIDGSPF